MSHVPLSSLVWRSSWDPGGPRQLQCFFAVRNCFLASTEVCVYYLFVMISVNYYSKSLRLQKCEKGGCRGGLYGGVQLPPVLCPFTSVCPHTNSPAQCLASQGWYSPARCLRHSVVALVAQSSPCKELSILFSHRPQHCQVTQRRHGGKYYKH